MSEIEDLKRRVEQLEKSLLAVLRNQPVGCDEHGRIMALPLTRSSVEPFGQQSFPVYGSRPTDDGEVG